MHVLDFDRKITIEDVNEINKLGECLIKINSTKEQDLDVISKLNDSCTICVQPKNLEKYNEITGKPVVTYNKEVFCKILNFLQKMDKDIPSYWSDMQKSVYLYSEIQKLPNEIKSEIEDEAEDKLRGLYNLSVIASKHADSQSLAAVLYEALNRQNIECRYMFNEVYQAWNEIKIDGRFYPVDLYADTLNYLGQDKQEVERNREKEEQERQEVNQKNQEVPRIKQETMQKNQRAPRFDYFGKSNFYDEARHYPCFRANLLNGDDIQRQGNIKSEAVEEIYQSLQEKQEEIEIKPERIERKDIKLKSKELSKSFENGEILANSFDGQESITLELTDDKLDDLIEDIDQIATFYPEMLETVEIKNETGTHIPFQAIVDKVYSAKKDNAHIANLPSSVRIVSTNPEDFDLDFSNAPKINQKAQMHDDEGFVHQRIEFINPDPNHPMKLPQFKNELPENINSLSFENIDFDGVSVNITRKGGVKDFNISGAGTQSIDRIPRIDGANRISIKNISDLEFNTFMSNVYTTCTSLDKISIEKQRLRDREIIRELAQNSNVAMFDITNSRLNTIEGIEDFNGRIAICNLEQNELGISAIERLDNLKRTNPHMHYSLINDKNILDEIDKLPAISNDTHKVMADYISQSGTLNMYCDKKTCLNVLADTKIRNVPIYAKDAHIVRTALKIKDVPMMIKDNSEFGTINFNSPDMQGGIMYLTLPQIDYMINNRISIPQSIRIKIGNVTELDVQSLENLQQRANASGLNLTEVQIMDKDNNNNWEMIGPYTIENYKKARAKLDKIVEGIDPSEPDIDKFITIYMRLAESIPYDHSVILNNPDLGVQGAIRYAKYTYAARNLEEGLLEGTCVCSGYSDIMNNALALVGVKSRTNSGLMSKTNGGGHAWNQVQIDGKWYYADVTWDEKKSSRNPKNRNYSWALLGSDEFVQHEVTNTKKIEKVEKNRYPASKLKEAIARNEHRSFDFTVPDIVIEPDPTLDLSIDEDSIKDEYKRRRDDMLAKYYGNKDYQSEYKVRSERFKSMEIDITAGGITYKTIDDYPERAEDEAFLFLDGYKDALERSSRFSAGDTSVYSAYGDPNAEYQKDLEYVKTRNHTFNQHENTNKDLATLGKYGERVPYIPRKQTFIANIGRAVANVGIFTRNIVAPAYRFVGKYVGQPLHKLITRNSDASPYRNNIYHRMVARRDYFEAEARKQDAIETARLRAMASDPSRVRPVSHPIRNAISSRYKAIVNYKEGNKAVLSAGLSNIKKNIRSQRGQEVMISALESQITELEGQITRLEGQINMYPNSRNIQQAKDELDAKRDNLDNARNRLDIAKARGKIYSTQTDAIDAKQHAVASKEVNTMRVTAIKGIAKGAAVKFLGPKLKDLVIQYAQKTEHIDKVADQVQYTKKWVEPTYKQEIQEIYDDVVDKTSSIQDMMAANKGKNITGFYSVAGGERGGEMYQLVGNEKITAIFQSAPNDAKGLSDMVGLKAPTLTDGTFSAELLGESGLLKQDISIDTLVSSLNSNEVDLSAVQDLYVSVNDRYWVKLGDLLPAITKHQKVDEVIKTVVDTQGHYENVKNIVKATQKATNVVTNPTLEKGANMIPELINGAVALDNMLDVNENLRKTRSNEKENDKDYDFQDEETRKIPTSREDYRDDR